MKRATLLTPGSPAQIAEDERPRAAHIPGVAFHEPDEGGLGPPTQQLTKFLPVGPCCLQRFDRVVSTKVMRTSEGPTEAIPATAVPAAESDP